MLAYASTKPGPYHLPLMLAVPEAGLQVKVHHLRTQLYRQGWDDYQPAALLHAASQAL